MHVRVHCFKNEFSKLTGASSPQTSPGLIGLESMVEGSLSTVIPRLNNKRLGTVDKKLSNFLTDSVC